MEDQSPEDSPLLMQLPEAAHTWMKEPKFQISIEGTDADLRHYFQPTQLEYAITQLINPPLEIYENLEIPVFESFQNWDEVFNNSKGCILTEGMCLVVFTSQRVSHYIKNTQLEKADHLAHTFAIFAKGYGGYYKGALTDKGLCKSFCFWETRDAAKIASRERFHSYAAEISNSVYEFAQIEVFQLIDRKFELLDRKVLLDVSKNIKYEGRSQLKHHDGI